MRERDTYLGHGFQTTCLPQVSSVREAEFREARAGRGKRGLETLCISELQKLFQVREPFFFLPYLCFPLFLSMLHPPKHINTYQGMRSPDKPKLFSIPTDTSHTTVDTEQRHSCTRVWSRHLHCLIFHSYQPNWVVQWYWVDPPPSRQRPSHTTHTSTTFILHALGRDLDIKPFAPKTENSRNQPGNLDLCKTACPCEVFPLSQNFDS